MSIFECTKRFALIPVFCLLAVFAGDVVVLYAEPIKATVTLADCGKCHEDIIRALKRKGMGHRNQCLECHQGHPPADVDIIPLCERCHTGQEHFTIGGCLGCHTNPHTPLEIPLTKDITGPCLSCHTRQIKELRDNPSTHTVFACTACHYYHGQIQPCGNCHKPHSDTMDEESCRACHQAHMPLVVKYGTDIFSEDCGSCHSEVYSTLGATLSKHRTVACIQCHPGRHRHIARCEDCHGRPHAAAILDRFAHCRECHGTAHDLQSTEASTSLFRKGRSGN